MNSVCFFFNDTATTEIYTLSLHDALPISGGAAARSEWLLFLHADTVLHPAWADAAEDFMRAPQNADRAAHARSEEHTSELQSRQYLVCRLLLEKKKKHIHTTYQSHNTTTS